MLRYGELQPEVDTMFRLTYRALALLVLISLAPAQAEPPSATPWLTVEESAGIVYFVFTAPARVERYDLDARAWLGDILLPAAPTAFAVDEQHLYVSFGRRTSRFSLGGSGEVHLKNTPQDVDILLVLGDQLVFGTYGSLWSLDKLTGAEIDFEEFFYSFQGAEVAPSRREIFSRTGNVIPADITVLPLNPDGTFGEQQGSPYHGDYPNAARVFVFRAKRGWQTTAESSTTPQT